MKPIITFLCTVLLAIASQVSGQNMSTSLTAVPLPGQPPYPVGSQVTINLNATNFTNVSSLLFPITYNSTVLRFDSIDNPTMPGYVDTTLAFHPNPGTIKITWFPSLIDYPNGVTIAGPNARLLTLRFTVIGNGTANVNLSTTVPFTPIEVINAMGNVIFNNTIFQSSGSNNNGVSIVGGTTPPPPPLVGFKIVANTVYARQGHRVCVPVTVNDFDSLILLQYAMHWDPAKLTYECVRGATNPIIPTFNPPAAAPGTLLMQWEDPNLLSGIGVTKPDGTRIYEVCFNTIGAPGEVNITIDGFGFGFPPNFSSQDASATNFASAEKWVTSGPNGASGVAGKVIIMPEPPTGTPVTYTADQDVVTPGGQTCVDIKVKNFASITESEFLFTYDATKLTYVSPITIPATALNLLPANVTHSVTGNTGTVKFKWSNAAGVTLADNTTIFSVCFNAIGSGVVPINFGTSACPNPTPFASAKKDTGGVPYKFENGQVTIMSQNGPPSAVATPALCSTGATGSVTVTPNGTATAYSWSNGMTTQNITGVAPGTYTVTVTYGASGTASTSTMVTAPQPINMTQSAVGVTCFGDSNGSINITPSGGTAPYTYSWSGPTSYTATTQNISGLKTGNYMVTITDANQCAFTSALVNVPTPSAISTPSNGIVITTVTCFGGANGAINIAPQGGTAPYTFDWSNDGPESPDNDPQNISGLTAGIYTVTITDSRGCPPFTPGGFTITAPQALTTAFTSKQDVTCFDSPTGKATISVSGGSGTKSFSWKTVPGGNQVSTVQSPSDLMPGTYNVIVTDGAGCTATATLPANVTINNAPSALSVSSTTQPGQCAGQANGSIDLTVNGGWGNYTYAWPSPLSGQDPNPVAPGTYTVTVTDQGLCTATHTAIVAGPPSDIAIGNPVVTHVSCFGQGNGGICLTLSGGNGAPYNVAWSNTPLTGACIGALPGGTYAPTVTDALGCTSSFAGIQVNAPAEILLDTTVTAANPTGSIDLSVTGGSPSYTYAWSNGTSNEDLLNVVSGTYTVTVTDANSCSKVAVYTVPLLNTNVFNPTPPTVSSITHSCNNDGCIFINIPGSAVSASPFTLSWAGGSLPASASLTQSICGLTPGPYVVTVTAANGNSATVTAQVNQLQQALLSSSTINQPFDELHNGSIVITAQFPNSTFLWNTGSTSSTLTNLDQGTYSVTVTNNTSGCTAVYPYVLTRQYFPYVYAPGTITNPTCASSANGSISIVVSGGNGPNYSYHWSGPNGFVMTTSVPSITGLKAGSYFVTVTDESGVENSHGPIVLNSNSSLLITNVNESSLTPGGTQVSGANTCDGVAAVVFSGQSGNASILWSNGVTTVENQTLCGGAYSVTVTDAQGCSSVWSDALTAPEAITSSSVGYSPKCFGQKNGSATVSPKGGIEPYDVLWSNGQLDQLVFANGVSEAVSLEAGTYTVTITDANNVTQTASIVVPEPTPMVASFTGVDPNSLNSCDGERIIFVSGGEAPYTYLWQTKILSGQTERAEGLCAGDLLYYSVTDANGCSISVIDSVPYPLDGCYKVRPVLTPAEDDGNNDYTKITCIQLVENTVEIYNRWGQLVFQTEGYNNDPSDPIHTWTGYFNGQLLPEGVYYYVLTIVDDKKEQHQFKGYINLLK